MMLTVNNVEELVSVVLVGVDDGKDVLLDLIVWNATFKWTIFRLESRSDIFRDLCKINDFAFGAF